MTKQDISKLSILYLVQGIVLTIIATIGTLLVEQFTSVGDLRVPVMFGCGFSSPFRFQDVAGTGHDVCLLSHCRTRGHAAILPGIHGVLRAAAHSSFSLLRESL